MKLSIKVVVYTHDGIRTLIESGYSIFLLKIPLFQGICGTFNDFEAVQIELNSLLFPFRFTKTDINSSAPVKFMEILLKGVLL